MLDGQKRVVFLEGYTRLHSLTRHPSPESARAGSTHFDESFPHTPVQHGRPDSPSGLATCVPLQCLYINLAWSSSCCCALCWYMVSIESTGLLLDRDAAHCGQPKPPWNPNYSRKILIMNTIDRSIRKINIYRLTLSCFIFVWLLLLCVVLHIPANKTHGFTRVY